jgi:hypothetical protein
MAVQDETGTINVRFFNERIKVTERLNGRLPVDDDIAIIEGEKKDSDLVFADRVGIQSAKIYMKLSELKDTAAKKAEKEAAVSDVPATTPADTASTT